MRVRWFRCYADIKDDPKCLGLKDYEFRVWIHLLALASQEDNHGQFPPITDQGYAAALRVSAGKWRVSRATFQRLRMVECSDDGLTIINWSKRQYVSDDSTQRSRKHRETAMQRSNDRSGNVISSATTENREQRTDPEAEAENRRRDYQAVENLTGHLSKPVIDAVDAFREDHPRVSEEWIVAACEEAAVNNGRSWKYVAAILKRWEREGFKADTKQRDGEPAFVSVFVTDMQKAEAAAERERLSHA